MAYPTYQQQLDGEVITGDEIDDEMMRENENQLESENQLEGVEPELDLRPEAGSNQPTTSPFSKAKAFLGSWK